MGAFFTNAQLAARAIRQPKNDTSADLVFADPACGAGDLLLHCATFLHKSSDLAETLREWQKRLYGTDVEELFVRAARARLILAAVAAGARRTGRTRIGDLDSLFSHLEIADGLTHSRGLCGVSQVVLNPPFSKIKVLPGCSWASGGVSSAAVFLAHALESADSSAQITAILPDVLRTGTRYARWRAHVEAQSVVEGVEVYGLFDAHTDIDVFVLRLRVPADPRRGECEKQIYPPASWWVESETDLRLGDFFEVAVGPVVPHRETNRGNWYPYLHARTAPPWKRMSHIVEHKRFRGRVFSPPFIVVRRTSGPREASRATATLVSSGRATAVENHLLVLRPHDGKLETCERGLGVLRSDRTNTWLNERIRCRHLTVGAVLGVPWEE